MKKLVNQKSLLILVHLALNVYIRILLIQSLFHKIGRYRILKNRIRL